MDMTPDDIEFYDGMNETEQAEYRARRKERKQCN